MKYTLLIILITFSLLLSACQPTSTATQPVAAPPEPIPTSQPAVATIIAPTPSSTQAETPPPPDNLAQPPTDLPDGKTLQNLMLHSHENWSSLWVEASGKWYSGEATNQLNSEERHQVWIRRPFYMLALSGPIQGTPNALYASDGSAYLIPGMDPQPFPEYILHPPKMPSVDTGLPVQPSESFIPNPLVDNLYPIGLAARPGEYRPIGTAVIANRPAYMLEWIPEFASQRLNRFWIDAQTGVILRLEAYTKPDGRYLTQEIEITSILYDVEIPESLFTLDYALPSSFAQAFNDLPGFSH